MAEAAVGSSVVVAVEVGLEGGCAFADWRAAAAWLDGRRFPAGSHRKRYFPVRTGGLGSLHAQTVLLRSADQFLVEQLARLQGIDDPDVWPAKEFEPVAVEVELVFVRLGLTNSSCRSPRSANYAPVVSSRSHSAIAAALAVARREGVSCDDPVVLREAWHVLLHLRPFPIVARASAPPAPGGPKPGEVVRELAVVSHASSRGAPVVPPSDEIDPGPHRHEGHVVTFWRYVETTGDLNPAAAGRALRDVHEALVDYDGPLPAAGHPEDLDVMFESLAESDDVAFLRDVACARPQLDGQALHGDAHLLNCIAAGTGPLWHDFETACRGPCEYDLAALTLRNLSDGGDAAAANALRAYGEHDVDLLRACVPVYAVWVYASLLTALPRRPELAPVVGRRLGWLRSFVDEVAG